MLLALMLWEVSPAYDSQAETTALAASSRLSMRLSLQWLEGFDGFGKDKSRGRQDEP